MSSRRLFSFCLIAAACGLSGSCRLPKVPPGSEVRTAIVPETITEIAQSVTPLDDTARFLAGMPGGAGSPLGAARQTESWQRFSRNMDELWRRFSVQRQPRIAGFSRSELGGLRNAPTVWYPFSGPDILFAEAFFPGAGHYELCGLESCEMLPDLAILSPDQQAAALDGLYTSLTSALSYSFFITKDMRVDLQRTAVKGTLPLCLVFLARLGYPIESVTPVSLASGGALVTGQSGSNCPGYSIRYRASMGRSKSLTYFTENVADFSLRADPRYLNYLRGYGPVVTYLKSASYLMHTDEFTMIRQRILDQSSALLQDDSGIPLRSLTDNRWDLTFYGQYTGVLDLFKEYYQADLMTVYQTGGPQVRGIDFGLGYKHLTGDTALILARKR
jgi:hypothetical protein